MFILGFFTGVFFVCGLSILHVWRNRAYIYAASEIQRDKDELLSKSLPIYRQAKKIFKEEDIDPQKIASLMMIAQLVDKSLEDEIANLPSNLKDQ